MTALHELTAAEAAGQIRERQLSSVELVEALLARIERLEPNLNAWVTLDADGARAAAREADEAVAGGRELGALHGVPVGLKDLYLTKRLKTTACFPPFESFVPDRDATSVARLRQAGAIVMGKTVTTQFAYADPSPTRNPWRADRTPGGSSSGSACAVAARMVPIAIGSQTAGSILRPAAYCGVVGFKPTHGLVDSTNVLPLAWSLDHVGPITRSVEDAALILTALVGSDISASGPSTSPPRLGFLTDLIERAEPEVAEHARATARRLADAGASVRELHLPDSMELYLAVHRVTMQAEAAAVHAGGIARYADAYSPRIRAEAMVGQLIPATAYLHAQRIRRRLREQTDALFGEVDALLLPTASNVAPAPETTGDPTFQAPWSLLGLPSISLPSGLSSDNLPFGTQLVGAANTERSFLGVAQWCETAIDVRLEPPVG